LLSHVNAGVLKVKLATAIIGISSIHLLKTFINAPGYDEKTLMYRTVIHVAFLVPALAIAFTERLATPQHAAKNAAARRDPQEKSPQEVEFLRA
jgi:uncharacterized protein (TIGR00645 family)